MRRPRKSTREGVQIRQGSLYPALYRLENRGWFKAEWKTTEGGRVSHAIAARNRSKSAFDYNYLVI